MTRSFKVGICGKQRLLQVLATSFVTVAGAELLHGHPGYGYCYKPTPPYRPYTFTSNEQVDSYNRSVDRYNEELRSYKKCMTRSYDSYEQRFKEYLQCEARSYGQNYSGCMKPSPP